MSYSKEQIYSIFKNNPNKKNIDFATSQNKELATMVHGVDYLSEVKQISYFENTDVYNVRKDGALSNKDMYSRLLSFEDTVFSAKGGSSFYNGLTFDQEKQMNQILSNLLNGYSLRQYVQRIVLDIYRIDPMGVLLMEISKDGQKIYPIYINSKSIYDYSNIGQNLNYIIIKLTVSDCLEIGINDANFKGLKGDAKTDYYRFIDDKIDNIFKHEKSESDIIDDNLIVIIEKPNLFGKCKAFIVSNINLSNNLNLFISPISKTLELAKVYQYDRSVRELTKKSCGFPKAIEPLLKCGTCNGTGQIGGRDCPDCNGTTYKMKTKPSDVARFSLSSLSEGFDFNKIFGYVSPPIDILDKQDRSLLDVENLIYDTYIGSDSHKVDNTIESQTTKSETATKTIENKQLKYLKLNCIADWGERIENMICYFVGKFHFQSSFKHSMIHYGRYFILESYNEIMDEYLTMREKKAPVFALNDQLSKFYHSFYATDHTQLQIKLKMINIEPYVHNTIDECLKMMLPDIDYYRKLYFSEWLSSKKIEQLVLDSEEVLKKDLLNYATEKLKLKPINNEKSNIN